MRVLRNIFLGLLMAALVAGCGLVAPTGDLEKSLENTKWLLISYRGMDVINEVETTALFQNGEVGGSSGCNQYGGQYTVGNARIEIVDLVSTLMFCVEPEGVMDQEGAFLEIMNDANRFEISNGRLRIYNKANEVLIFKVNQ